MINYLIIDDEYIAHDIIKGYCGLLPTMQFKKSCYDALEAIDYLSNHSVDLIFLDLNMPKLKGFEFLKTLASPPSVIVTTAYKEFALEGYELNIVDYLLKPFSFERFLKAINKVLSESHSANHSTIQNKEAGSGSIFLRSNKKYIQVTIDTIQYIEAAGNYTKLFTTEEMIEVREKISDVFELFRELDFIQVHKSFAVSKKHIKSIEGNRIFIDEYVVPIGKTYKANVLQLLK